MTRRGAGQVLYHKGRKDRQQLLRDQGDEETATQHTHTPTEHPNLKTSATTVGGELDWIGTCLRVRMPLFFFFEDTGFGWEVWQARRL